MTPKEKIADIEDVLRQVSGAKNFHMDNQELRAMSMRLLPLHGVDLFRVLWAIPGEAFFPSVWEIEHKVRGGKGLPPGRGLTEEMIARNERELVVSGVSPEAARKGAEFARKTLRHHSAAPVKSDLCAGIPTGFEGVPLAPPDPLAGLEDFGDEEKSFDPLAELAEF